MGVELVKLDMTKLTPEDKAELSRCDMKNLPVNLIYPPNYPDEPAIMLPEFLSPGVALEALGRIEPKPDQPSETVEAAKNNDGEHSQSSAG